MITSNFQPSSSAASSRDGDGAFHDGVEDIRNSVYDLGRATVDMAQEKVHKLEEAGVAAIASAKTTGDEQLNKFRDYTRQQPLTVALAGIGLGLFAGMLLRGSR